ncbi:hypothetical protein CTAYLR_001106 [Chrysophaeum taylorii]|uniref:PH domain-containing protein n=1 Tax=Chrysophaeum taylorii TaxID=2483200 RepID=A0AAD7UP20_9STRA|nr:hypothetical protein CTAYLR_001106 [Chrysophaeum taylorii]
MNVSKYGDWGDEEHHRVYRTHVASSVVGWVVGRRHAPEAPQATKTFTSLDVRLEGMLWKEGSWRKNWKQRFFVLRRDAFRLSYYDAPRSLKLLGEVVLFDASRGGEIKVAIIEPATGQGGGFAVRCAATGRELRLRADSSADRDRWLRAIRLAIDHALKECLRSAESPISRPTAFSSEEEEAVGVHVTLHLTRAPSSGGDDDEKTPPASLIECGSKRWREVARTEVVKAGDSGAFACETGQQRGLDVVRQFSVLLPPPGAWGGGAALIAVYRRVGEGDALRRHARAMIAELSKEKVSRVATDAARQAVVDLGLVAEPKFHRLYRRRRRRRRSRSLDDEEDAKEEEPVATTFGRVLLVGVEAFDGDSSSSSSSSKKKEGWYARQHYQLRSRLGRARYGHVVASEGLRAPTAALPAALVGLVVDERTERAASLADEARRAAERNRTLAAELRRKAREAALVVGEKTRERVDAQNVVAAARAARHVDGVIDQVLPVSGKEVALARRLKTAKLDEEAAIDRLGELDAGASAVETLSAELEAMTAGIESYAGSTLDDVYARARDVLASDDEFASVALSNVHVADARPAILKRSTAKKDRDLQFAPTNLNWHRLAARRSRREKPPRRRATSISFGEACSETSWTGLDPRHTTSTADPPSSSDDEDEEVVVHSTLTFGVTAAHAKGLGFKDGGLSRLVAKLSDAKSSSNDGSEEDLSRLLSTIPGEERRRRVARCLSLQLFGGLDAATVSAVERKARAATPESGSALAAFSRRAILAERVDVVVAQALALAGAHVEAVLGRRDPDVFARAFAFTSAGPGRLLLGVECLLSTLNDELGMLEDLVVAADWLSTLRFRFLEASDDQQRWRVRRADSSGALVVDLRVDDPRVVAEIRRASAAGLPNQNEEDVIGATRIEAVLFSQGINEWQTVANNLGTARLQAEVNAAGRDALSRHVDWAHRVSAELALGDLPRASRSDRAAKHWRALLASVYDAVRDTSTPKNVHLLLATSDLCRALVGSHCICCKSGKDRSAMAVTLEQTRTLASVFGVFDERHVCLLLRRHGVRRVNVLANTGQDKYAFNAMQVQSLPRCYRPPAGTYSGSTAT